MGRERPPRAHKGGHLIALADTCAGDAVKRTLDATDVGPVPLVQVSDSQSRSAHVSMLWDGHDREAAPEAPGAAVWSSADPPSAALTEMYSSRASPRTAANVRRPMLRSKSALK